MLEKENFMWLNIFFVILNAMLMVANYSASNYKIMAFNAFCTGFCVAMAIVNYFQRAIAYEQ